MSGQAYIVSNALLEASPPQGKEWHATVIPGDPTQSLVVVVWDNPNMEAEWEAKPEVLPLGEPWEAAPADAIPLLESFQPAPAKNGVVVMRTIDPAATPETVSATLRKVEWPGWKLIR